MSDWNPEAGKYSDEQIELIRDKLNYEYDFCEDSNNSAVAQEFYKEGCRILSDDEHIVKPLTDYDIEKLWEHQDWQVGELEFIVIAKAIQRELGIGE